jgi:hypothetical protein
MAMLKFPFGARSLAFPLALSVASCLGDPDGGEKPQGGGPSYGSFLISLVEPTATAKGFTSVLGAITTFPTPASLSWEEGAQSGSCRIYKPHVPFCETPCGSEAICVEDGKCQEFPKSLGAGKVTVKGVKTKAGANSFTMDPTKNNYQPDSRDSLAFPPFAEGDEVGITAAGDSSVAAFSVSVKGIAPLVALKDSFALADGQPIGLEWTPAKDPQASRVSILVDLSHHGGTKGKIVCEGPDNGKLEIPAVLVDGLKALGVSGFPKIEISRKAIATNPDVHVDLVLESLITLPLSVPGIVSCIEDSGCPDGQTCQRDSKCK